MAIRTATLRTQLAARYAAIAVGMGLFSSDPGATGAVASELTGGSPAYARKTPAWGTATASAVSAPAVPFDVPSGATVAGFGVTASTVAGTADLLDYGTLTQQVFSSQGTYSVTPTYTQS